MLTPITPYETEVWRSDFARRLLSLVAEAQALDEFARREFTEAKRASGTLLQGHHADTGEPVPWTTEQLAEAAISFQRIGDVARALERRDGAGGSILADMQSMIRPAR